MASQLTLSPPPPPSPNVAFSMNNAQYVLVFINRAGADRLKRKKQKQQQQQESLQEPNFSTLFTGRLILTLYCFSLSSSLFVLN